MRHALRNSTSGHCPSQSHHPCVCRLVAFVLVSHEVTLHDKHVSLRFAWLKNINMCLSYLKSLTRSPSTTFWHLFDLLGEGICLYKTVKDKHTHAHTQPESFFFSLSFRASEMLIQLIDSGNNLYPYSWYIDHPKTAKASEGRGGGLFEFCQKILSCFVGFHTDLKPLLYDG